MESKLYVGNLSFNVSDEELKKLFSNAGEVNEVALITDRDTGRPRGFGFIEMATKEGADKAIEMYNDYEMDGRRMVVNIAKPREDRNGGGGRGRGGFGGGGRGGFGGGGGGRGGFGGGGGGRGGRDRF